MEKKKKKKIVKKKLSKQSTSGEEKQSEKVVQNNQKIETEEAPVKITQLQDDEIQKIQLEDISSIIINHEIAFRNERAKKWEHKQWKHYLDGMVNPLVMQEINSYITIWKDSQDDPLTMLNKCSSCLKLIRQLEIALEDAPDKTSLKEAIWRESMKNLQDVLEEKVNEAIYGFLVNSEQYIDIETFNMQHVQYNTLEKHPTGTESISLYLWANLSQIPIYKGPNFSEVGHMIEIPYSLRIRRCAIVILHTVYDFYSPMHLDIEEEKEQNDIETSSDANIQISSFNLENLATVTPEEQLLSPIAPSFKRESISAASADSEIKSQTSTQSIENETENSKDIEEPLEVIDMKGNYIVGGVFHVVLTEIPPQPVKTGGWIVQQVEEKEELLHIPFYTIVVPPHPPKPNMKPTEVATFAEAENKRYEEELINTISISLKLSEDILFLDQPCPAFWCQKKNCWVANGFHEVKYSEENRQLTFKAVHWGIIGIIQNKYINFPYQGWQLKPLKNLNACLLIVTTSMVSLSIEIVNESCRLTRLQTLEESVLYPNIGKEWTEAKQLLKDLRDAGVFLIPDENAKKYLGNIPKDSQLEDNVYKQMALHSNVYAFGWSHWNSTKGPQKVIMKCTETCGREVEGINTLLMVDQKQAFFLQCGEMSSSFNDTPAENSQYCSTLYHLLLSYLLQDGLQRIEKCESDYYNCVYTLLSSMKLLSY